jgi:DNA mismatch endonuclease (patch repair protein)
MRATVGRNNAKELAVRALLFRHGIRFRVNYPVPELPRRSIDIAIIRIRLAVFIDGCFWHGCPIHRSMPKANQRWWAEKLKRNIERDAETTATLIRLGWTVERYWGHTHDSEIADSVLRKISAINEALG